MIVICWHLMITPIVHDLIGVFWIIRSDFAIYEIILRNVIICRFAVAKLGFYK